MPGHWENLELREEAINKESTLFLQEKIRELESIKLESEKKEVTILDQRNQLDSQRRAAAALEARLQEAERENIVLQRRITALTTENASLSTRVTELESTLRRANQAETELLAEVSSLRDQISRMVPANELEHTQRELSNALGALAEQRESNNRLSRDLDRTVTESTTLAASVRAKEREIDALSSTLAAKNREVTEEKSNRLRAEGELDNTLRQRDDQTAQNESLRADLTRYTRLLSDTSSRLQDAENDLIRERADRVNAEKDREDAAERRMNILQSRISLEQRLGDTVTTTTESVSPRRTYPVATTMSSASTYQAPASPIAVQRGTTTMSNEEVRSLINTLDKSLADSGIYVPPSPKV